MFKMLPVTTLIATFFSTGLFAQSLQQEALSLAKKYHISTDKLSVLTVKVGNKKETLININANKKLTLASLSKVVTSYAVLKNFPSDYQFVTKIKTDGKIEKNTLQGNLYLVGKGGKGYPAIRTSVFANVGSPHYIFASGADDGLGGYPGGSTKIISPTMGTILECAGGSGAAINGIDSYAGGLMAGGISGIISTSGNPNWPSPNRIAAGPYAQLNNAGTCGTGGYGVGNRGTDKYNFTSGTIEGGPTPFGYGSGGDITAFGCYVNATTTGTCVFPDDGSDGVVYIDIW